MLELYNKYRAVPSNALKEFNNGRFKGTDINTQWRIKCLTEEFGACGVGWYFDIVRTWTEQGASECLMCFAEIKLYIKHNGEWSKPISGTGGSQLVQSFKSGLSNNDEGYKMAVTDAFGVACKHLGIGADVYWNNDRTKYSSEDKPITKKHSISTVEQLTPVTDGVLPWELSEEIVADIYATAKEKKYSAEAVEKSIQKSYGKDIYDLTLEEANDVLKKLNSL